MSAAQVDQQHAEPMPRAWVAGGASVLPPNPGDMLETRTTRLAEHLVSAVGCHGGAGVSTLAAQLSTSEIRAKHGPAVPTNRPSRYSLRGNLLAGSALRRSPSASTPRGTHPVTSCCWDWCSSPGGAESRPRGCDNNANYSWVRDCSPRSGTSVGRTSLSTPLSTNCLR